MGMTGGGKKRERKDLWVRALERGGLGVWDWDLVSDTCYYSPTWSRMLGYADGELPMTADTWLTLTHPDDREQAIASGERHLAGLSDSIETELRLRHKDGHWIWVLDRGGVVERDTDGRPTRMVGVQTDITRRKRAEEELAQVNARFRLALAASETGIWHHDLATRISSWDTRTREMFGLPPGDGEMARNVWNDHLHPDDRAEAERLHMRPIETGDTANLCYRIVRADGEVRHVETLAKFIAEAGPAGRLVGTIRDVTEAVLAAEALQLEKERLRVTLRSISDAVMTTDNFGAINFVNRAAVEMAGLCEAELIGCDFDRIYGALRAGDAGGARSFRSTSSPILSAAGDRLGTVYTIQDVTEDLRRERELAYAARHDSLTGLLNRAAFDEALAERLANAETQPFAIHYIDLDYFKALNDFAGHAAGDIALQRIGGIIRSILPKGAMAARLGGDEFSILAPLTDDPDAVAAVLLRAIGDQDFGIGVGSPKLGASVGVAVITDPSIIASDALARADDACYAAKASGRNRCVSFDEGVASPTAGLTAARIVSETIDAMEDARLKLFGQEIHELGRPWTDSRRVEVLARLEGRDGKLIPPSAFVPAAERFGMAARLDRWIIKSALARHGEAMSGEGGLTLGFNLSAQTLSDPNLWEFVDEEIASSKASHANLVFEITETAAITNFDAAERFVHNARARRCRVSLDDFGSGLSSFDYLRRFPVDSLKIDGDFIQNLASSRFDQAIVSAINDVARAAGFSVVAEKIEDRRTLEMLIGIGVKFGQGFLLHKPEPLSSVVARLDADQSSMSPAVPLRQ